MKVLFFYTSVALLATLSGCSGNALVQRLKESDATEANIVKLRFISSEGAFGSGTMVVVNDADTIKSIWSKIKGARPTEHWCASGFHRIEFFTSNDAEVPVAAVLLNESDAAYLKGDLWYHLDSKKPGYYGLWKCVGLNELVMEYLKGEYDRRQTSLEQTQSQT